MERCRRLRLTFVIPTLSSSDIQSILQHETAGLVGSAAITTLDFIYNIQEYRPLGGVAASIYILIYLFFVENFHFICSNTQENLGARSNANPMCKLKHHNLEYAVRKGVQYNLHIICMCTCRDLNSTSDYY